MTDQTTVKTSASKALTDLQAARQEVQRAGVTLANERTRAAKIALRQAQAKEANLLKKYHDARLLQLAAVTARMKRDQ